MKKQLAFISLAALLTNCSSKPVLMTPDDVEVSRKDASSKCKELGMVSGRTRTIHGTAEEALKDLKAEASAKGANYVKIQSQGVNTKDLAGTAYDCP